MTHPQILVTVDGTPVSGVFFDRLISLTITDREGIRSDSLELVFSDAAPHFQSPRRGAVVAVTIADDAGGGFVGSYVVDRVDLSCLPYTITVRGHSSDLRSGMKTSKARHWDNKSVRDIVTEKADDHGLKPKISDQVSGHVYDYIAQQDESDLHFLERLARRHSALFTIKNGTLLWLERGSGATADGTAITAQTVLAPTIIAGSCRVSEGDIDRFKRVKAYWHDREAARRREIVIEVDPEAAGDHVLRDPYATREEAKAAAESAGRDMLGGLVETECSIVGRPALMAGQPVIYAGVHPRFDGREFILDLVTHSFSKPGGLRTSFTGKLKTGSKQAPASTASGAGASP